MKKYLVTSLAIILLYNPFYGQESKLPYEAKIADLGEIQIEYMDFGGQGTPLIWVQDFHNYFDGPYKDTVLVNYISSLSQHASLLAPLRRGYGNSTDTEWGYDVATQAEDLLGFMDALGIEKAILFGRQPANQDMTWIAEHHPERLAGLIFWGGNPILIVGCNNKDELLLMENWSAFAPDFEKEKEKRVVMSRAFWRPHILTEPNRRIDIPTLRILNSAFSNTSVVSRLAETERMADIIKEEVSGYEEEIRLLRELAQDSVRLVSLQHHLKECDPSQAIDQAMERAFGKNLRTVKRASDFSSRKDYEEFLIWELEEARKFINELEN